MGWMVDGWMDGAIDLIRPIERSMMIDHTINVVDKRFELFQTPKRPDSETAVMDCVSYFRIRSNIK